eukprot:10424500-Alexandrium_andersonii.AAC.1
MSQVAEQHGRARIVLAVGSTHSGPFYFVVAVACVGMGLPGPAGRETIVMVQRSAAHASATHCVATMPR